MPNQGMHGMGRGRGAATVWTQPYAAPPQAPQPGDLWLPSDGIGLSFVRTSGAWVGRWGGTPTTDPTTPTWAWVNQGSATTSDVGGSVGISNPANATAGFHFRKKAVPSTPYTLTVGFLSGVLGGAAAGLILRASASGHIIAMAINDSHDLVIQNFNGPNGSDFVTNTLLLTTLPYGWQTSPLWFRVADNGTTRTYHLLTDGPNGSAVQVYSEAHTAFITPDEVGWGPYTHATYATTLRLIHWQEA